MSSMVRTSTIAALLASVLSTSAPVGAQDSISPQGIVPGGAVQSPQTQSAQQWDNARATLVARAPGQMAGAIARWQQLTASRAFGFDSYASFLLSYPGFPDEDKLREVAELRLASEFVPPERVLAFFDRFPPLTNPGRAQFAVALMQLRPAQAEGMARAAWVSGEMTDAAESLIRTTYGSRLISAEQDGRMDALLWQRNRAAAERQFGYTSPARRAAFAARLAILQGGEGVTADSAAASDAGYLYNRSRELRTEGRGGEAVALLANRPPLSAPPFDKALWVDEQLAVARLAGARSAQLIASRIDETFAAGTDVAGESFKLRDNYTSLMWLGGSRALWELGDGTAAAPLFYRYGTAARTPQTRSKGFYWAGHAAAIAGDPQGAHRYYEMAAQYPDRFYGQLALRALGRPMPSLAAQPQGAPTAAERAAFYARPITAAVTEVARDAPWHVGIRFYRAIADQAQTLSDHLLVAELAQSIGRRDLAVNLSDAAAAEGHPGFTAIGFPTLNAPAGTDWTVVHAISRQESQFAQNALSHAGARGLMQLMPGTAREQAGKNGVAFLQASLIDDPDYNLRLGDAYFERIYARYGSYPLAIAAYNAGPGNVNKWLAAYGDPRTGAISWVDWIEKIPLSETKNYITRVLENAVVYEALNPDHAPMGKARELGEFLR
ncbi:MAG: hypothetical protein RLZZ08_632 [Pseudomonadota bacterium]|jgi:soluble lytic murein transglycosylase